MKKLESISTQSLRWIYLVLTTVAFIAALVTYNWLYYGKSILFWLPAALVLLATVLLSYLVKKELEARSEPLLIFNTLQQIVAVLIALTLSLIVLIFKVLNNTDNDVNKVYWLLIGIVLLIILWNSIELCKEFKRRKVEKDSRK